MTHSDNIIVNTKGQSISDTQESPTSVKSLLVLKKKESPKKTSRASLKNTVHSQMIFRCMVLMG